VRGGPLRELAVDVRQENFPDGFARGKMMRDDGTYRSAPNQENMRRVGRDAVEPRSRERRPRSMSVAAVRR
jgi:hypothetical protein